jgi:hypothetical protein
VISFSKGRAELAERHLKLPNVDLQYPLPELLRDHLAQGVWRHCLYPGWQQYRSRRDGLDSVPEEIEETSSEDHEPQEGESADPASSLAGRMQRLNIDSQGGHHRMMRQRAQIEQFSMKEREHGEGKFAFESYLVAALSARDNTIPALWGYTEED